MVIGIAPNYFLFPSCGIFNGRCHPSATIQYFGLNGCVNPGDPGKQGNECISVSVTAGNLFKSLSLIQLQLLWTVVLKGQSSIIRDGFGLCEMLSRHKLWMMQNPVNKVFTLTNEQQTASETYRKTTEQTPRDRQDSIYYAPSGMRGVLIISDHMYYGLN